MIIELNQVNTNTDEGKLLLASLAILTSELHTDKTPNEVIDLLNILSKQMFDNIGEQQ